MARKDPPSLLGTDRQTERQTDGSMAMRRFQGDAAMQPVRDTPGTGVHPSFGRDPDWTDPRPHNADAGTKG